jgi:hypothetical protein
MTASRFATQIQHTVPEALTAMREDGFDVLVSDFNVVSHMTAVPSPAPCVVLRG